VGRLFVGGELDMRGDGSPQALQRGANPQTIEALGQAIADALRGAQIHQWDWWGNNQQ
jgi:hypothetical protein